MLGEGSGDSYPLCCGQKSLLSRVIAAECSSPSVPHLLWAAWEHDAFCFPTLPALCAPCVHSWYSVVADLCVFIWSREGGQGVGGLELVLALGTTATMAGWSSQKCEVPIAFLETGVWVEKRYPLSSILPPLKEAQCELIFSIGHQQCTEQGWSGRKEGVSPSR